MEVSLNQPFQERQVAAAAATSSADEARSRRCTSRRSGSRLSSRQTTLAQLTSLSPRDSRSRMFESACCVASDSTPSTGVSSAGASGRCRRGSRRWVVLVEAPAAPGAGQPRAPHRRRHAHSLVAVAVRDRHAQPRNAPGAEEVGQLLLERRYRLSPGTFEEAPPPSGIELARHLGMEVPSFDLGNLIAVPA